MWRRRLFWKLFVTYTLVIVFCIGLVGGYLIYQERRSARTQLEGDLALLARVLDERLHPFLDEARSAEADSLVRAISPPDIRITLITPEGRVIADTNVDPGGMENHRFRPEVQAALRGGVTVVQYREKHATTRVMIEQALALINEVKYFSDTS